MQLYLKLLTNSIIKSTRMALNDIGTNKIEIYPKDTNLDPNKSLESALELKNKGYTGIVDEFFLYLLGILITYIMCYRYVPYMRTDRYKDT